MVVGWDVVGRRDQSARRARPDARGMASAASGELGVLRRTPVWDCVIPAAASLGEARASGEAARRRSPFFSQLIGCTP